ncbi:hypothetical protein H0X09_02400 [Candidatus Saccharibacteria bacterium]|nr:hypothetical protein [Candidatus Saccharibacteria bacterium]
MKRDYDLKNIDVKKYYLIRKPTRMTDLDYDDMYTDDYDSWREKSRRLQARRWRRIKHQLA